MTNMKIEIAIDNAEAEEFCAWLNVHGHVATVGNSTGTYINGVSTNDDDTNEMMHRLWSAYCNS